MQLVVGHGNTPISTDYAQTSPGTLNFVIHPYKPNCGPSPSIMGPMPAFANYLAHYSQFLSSGLGGRNTSN